MRIVGFTGPSGSGKTTLIEKLIRLYVSAGQSVCAVKHTHHRITDLRRGDSQRFLEAGASTVLLVGETCWKLTPDRADRHEVASLNTLMKESDASIVLVEGFKREASWPKIAVVTASSDPAVKGCIAVITSGDQHATLPTFHRDDVEGIRGFLDRIGATE